MEKLRGNDKNDKVVKELTEEKQKLSIMLKAAEEKIRTMDAEKSKGSNLEEKNKTTGKFSRRKRTRTQKTSDQ